MPVSRPHLGLKLCEGSGLSARSGLVGQSLRAPPHYKCSHRRASCSPTMAIMTSPRQQPACVRGTDTMPSSAGTDNNRRIRLAATWQDVQAAIQEQQSISAGTAAYALYRLGCLYSFMTWQRRAALEQSGLIERLLQIIGEDVGAFGATEVTLTLDGLARLRQQPSSILLDALAKQAGEHARNLQPSQVPLILWAFAMLNYNPLVAVLAALDQQVERLSSQITAQGISLVLWSYQTWRHHPEGSTLAALSAAIRHRVMSFKPSELATSMDAYSALGFHPGNDVVQAVASRVGCVAAPAALASTSAVAHHKALDAWSVGFRRAAADAVSANSEGKAAKALYAAASTSAKETAAAVSASGRAAAEGVKRKAQRAKVALREAGEGLARAPAGLGASMGDWLYEFGQQQDPRTPMLCAAVAQQPLMSRSRWPIGRDPRRNMHADL
ncbi:g7043 [Coccomyxa elongata]